MLSLPLLLVLASLVVTSVARVVPTKSCAPIAKCDVNVLDISPWPAAQGHNTTATATLSCDTTVKSGDKAKWKNTVSVYEDSGYVCDAIAANPCKKDGKCDCPPGNYTTAITLEVPWIAPSGTYQGRFQAFNWNMEFLVCVTYSIDVHPQMTTSEHNTDPVV